MQLPPIDPIHTPGVWPANWARNAAYDSSQGSEWIICSIALYGRDAALRFWPENSRLAAFSHVMGEMDRDVESSTICWRDVALAPAASSEPQIQGHTICCCYCRNIKYIWLLLFYISNSAIQTRSARRLIGHGGRLCIGRLAEWRWWQQIFSTLPTYVPGNSVRA
jgi:hypothetical protein